MTVQDTRTPPLLDAVYEQITRGAAEYNDLVTINSVGHSPLADQISGHTRDIQTAQTCRKNQEPEPSRPSSNKSVDSPSGLHRQLEISRAREQSLHADLFAAQKERDSLKALISNLETSQREQRRWEKIAEAARARHKEAEAIASRRTLDLSAAVDRISDVQEQLRDQKQLVSRKETAVQSITRKSRLAHAKLKWAEYKITRLDEKLREERDRRVRETKELMHEQVMLQGRHRSEMRRVRQEAEDALRDARLQSLLERDHPRRQPPTATTSYDTGQGSIPPKRILASGTLPARSPTNPDSSSRPTGQSPLLPNQDELDYTARLVAPWLEIPSCLDMESEVAKESRAALEEMIELMREVDPPVTRDVKPNEHEKTVHLQEELVATKERLRLSEEEARDMQCQLEQSKETLREVETQVMTLEFELKICQETLREVQDAQHANEVKFTEADQLLRLRQAESESSTARAEESELKCSQARLLCAALQERVTELEEQVVKLKSAPKHIAITEAHTKSRSLCPAVSHTGTNAPTLRGRECSCISLPLDPEGTTHNPDIQDSASDSIYMTVSPSVPRLLDLSLPPSLPSSDSFYSIHQKCSATLHDSAHSRLFRARRAGMLASVLPRFPILIYLAPSDSEPITHNADVDSIHMTFPSSLPCILDFSLPPSPSPSRTSSLTSSLHFLHQECLATRPTSCPADSGMAHPLLRCYLLMFSTLSDLDVIAPNSTLRPSFQDFSLAPFELPRAFLSKGNSFGSMDWPPIVSSLFPGDGNARKDQVPEARKYLSHNSSILIADRVFLGSVISDVDRESPSCAPIWTTDLPPSLAPPTDERRVEVSLRLDREEAYSSQRDCGIACSASTEASLHLPSPPRIYDLASPTFPRISLPPLSFPHDDCRAAPVRLERSGLFNPAVVTLNGMASDHCVLREFGEWIWSGMIAGFANLFRSPQVWLC